MAYHIETGLIKEKFKTDCECPLCEIQKIVEDGLMHEFLNDAVMEDDSRILVAQKGFCAKHFDLMLKRPNKLSLALQVNTRTNAILKGLTFEPSIKKAKKLAGAIDTAHKTCVICDFTEESMEKYYKTVAELFLCEPTFRDTLKNTKGFCLHHYAELLRYAGFSGKYAKEYLAALYKTQTENLKRLQGELKWFCDKHDYRNADKPLGSAETALPRTSTKLYGKKPE